ncbi:hypothetical protein C8J57DRAFT_1467064 [Mycena rebaudengoi]|nr:hypothetical protein C8J57DRAFT_1467064 [Mycena rebaudengoi]
MGVKFKPYLCCLSCCGVLWMLSAHASQLPPQTTVARRFRSPNLSFLGFCLVPRGTYGIFDTCGGWSILCQPSSSRTWGWVASWFYTKL